MNKSYEKEALKRCALDRAVGTVMGLCLVWQGSCYTIFTKDPDDEQILWQPSQDLEQAEDVIRTFNVEIVFLGGRFIANTVNGRAFFGPTRHLAALHAVANIEEFAILEVVN